MNSIGIIDSGIGGLTILKQLISKNLDANFYYISDEDNVPYGGKSQTFMLSRMKEMTEKLIKKNVQGILIACNTATAETIDHLRNHYKIPFIGIEPYINYINKLDTKEKKLGVILTQATFNSNRFKNLVISLDPKKLISIYPLQELALLIEKLKYSKFEDIKQKVDKELLILKDQELTHLILGCTHYPILSKYIESTLDLVTIDPSAFVIDQLIESLGLKILKKTNKNEFYYNANNSSLWKKTDLKSLIFI